MSRIVTMGFEENKNNTNVFVEVGGTTPTVGTTNVHSGTYALKAAATTAASFGALDLIDAYTSGTIFVRGYFYIVSNVSSNVAVLRMRSNAAANAVGVVLNSAGTWALSNAITANTQNGSTSLGLNTWYRVEFKAVLSDTTGSAEAKLFLGESTSALETLTIAGPEDTLPVNVSRVHVGWTANATGEVWFDDVAINTAAGSFQTGYPGPGKTAMVVPASDVTNQWFDAVSGASTFANINALPGAINDATYNKQATTLNQIDQFGLTTLPAEVTSDAVMAVLHVYGRCGSNQTSAASMRFKVWDDTATLTNGTSFNVGVNGWIAPGTGNAERLLPVDLTGKTKANVQSYNIGYENITETVGLERRVSELWANIEWLENTAGPATQFGDYAGEFKILRPTYW